MSSLGGRLREARMSARLSQADLANRLSVSQSAVAHWERDKNEPNLEQVLSLCRALQIDRQWLAFGSATGRKVRVIAIMKNGEIFPPESEEYVALPPFADGEQLLEAIVVKDMAAYPQYREGDVLYVTRAAGNLHELAQTNVECVVELEGGGQYYRRIAATNDPTLWTLIGWNVPPVPNVRIRMARPVAWVHRNLSVNAAPPIN